LDDDHPQYIGSIIPIPKLFIGVSSTARSSEKWELSKYGGIVWMSDYHYIQGMKMHEVSCYNPGTRDGNVGKHKKLGKTTHFFTL